MSQSEGKERRGAVRTTFGTALTSGTIVQLVAMTAPVGASKYVKRILDRR